MLKVEVCLMCIMVEVSDVHHEGGYVRCASWRGCMMCIMAGVYLIMVEVSDVHHGGGMPDHGGSV